MSDVPIEVEQWLGESGTFTLPAAGGLGAASVGSVVASAQLACKLAYVAALRLLGLEPEVALSLEEYASLTAEERALLESTD